MPRGRSPNRYKAFEIYKKHEGKIENRRIAEMLQISEKTISGWKCKDTWDANVNGVLQKSKRSTPKKKGAQPGNKNAVGNKGGAAPKQNKNALKTGEFETLFFDTLAEDEKRLIEAVQLDKERLLLQEIQLLTVRERRMMKRIEELRLAAEVEMENEEKTASKKGMTIVKYQSGIEKGKPTELKEYSGILGQMQAVEDALTRVQARRQKAIDSLHRFGIDDAQLEIQMIKLELESLKLDDPEEEKLDDGFVEAMNGIASEVWSDADEC